MPLPENFSPWEHLFEQLISSYNPIVERSFPDIEFGDINSVLGGMYVACVIQPDDTVEMVVLRLFLYFFVFKQNLPTPVYGIPIPEYQTEFKHRPQIQLLFKERWTAFLMENRLQPATARISFRLMTETKTTLNAQKAQQWALKIKEFLGQGQGFAFEKGTTKYTYKDEPNGLDFRVLANSLSEAEKVMSAVAELAGHGFNASAISTHSSNKEYPTVPGYQEVYGKEIRSPRLRPVAEVYFHKAELHIPEYKHPIVLLDKSGKSNPIEFY